MPELLVILKNLSKEERLNERINELECASEADCAACIN